MVRVKSSSTEPAGPTSSSHCSLGLPRDVLHEMVCTTVSLKKHSPCPSKKANRWSDENERGPGEAPVSEGPAAVAKAGTPAQPSPNPHQP